jgi:hypothetical protein
MSIIGGILTRGDINFPSPNSKFIIEWDSHGEVIHIHMGRDNHPTIPNDHWQLRIHMTYDELNELCDKIKSEEN